MDVDLELLPGKAVRPLVGFSYSRYAGPGLTTYHVGQDEFGLDQDLKEKDTEYRIGVAFDAGAFSGQVVQGGGSSAGEETLRLSTGAGAGNTRDDLGVPIDLTSLTRTSKTDIDTRSRRSSRKARQGRPADGHLRPGEGRRRGRQPGEPRGQPRLLRHPAVLQDLAEQTSATSRRSRGVAASGPTSTSRTDST
ncbi:MAG: hypothetical protein IPF66_24155 [Holophagales bacterium]|nr:hypothetical protein [Holophagales bacterium]